MKSNNKSSRCPELQVMLNAPFNFCIKWGIGIVTLFMVFVMVFCYFIDTEYQTNISAECKSVKNIGKTWVVNLYVQSCNYDSVNAGQKALIKSNHYECSGTIISVESEQNQNYILVQLADTPNIAINSHCTLIITNKKTIGEVILFQVKS